MPQNIYFDESGFTGPNLLHPTQKLFCYASVATDDQEAREFVEGVVAKFRVQGGELKGKGLVRYSKGRKAIDEIFRHFRGRLRLSVADKKYALACKLHEYIFEPCYSDAKSLFYGLGFHRFIANLLYLEFVVHGAGAKEIFSEFETLMREKDVSRIAGLFSSSMHPNNSPMLTQIREFAQFRGDDIRAELAAIDSAGIGRWVLDLTHTSLYSLLAYWGTKYEQINAICDASKPLQYDQYLFAGMIGNENGEFSDVFGQRYPTTFNLSGRVQFGDSRSRHGIQIADAVAAAAVYTLSGATDEQAARWRSIVSDVSHTNIIPDEKELSVRDPRVQLNTALLIELHSRAKAGKSLTEGMSEHISMMSKRLGYNPIS